MAKKGATGDPFFSFLQKKKKIDIIFNVKKKKVEKRKKIWPPTGFNFSHPLDRKQNYFYGQPKDPYPYANVDRITNRIGARII